VTISHNKSSEDNNEIALIKLSNVREGEAAAVILSGRGTGSEKDPNEAPEEIQFAPEKLPTKIPLVKPNSNSLNTIVYHCEAPYSVRKVLIEQAKKNFKELEKAEVN
jgi:predicted TIM-barrel enzyme